MSDIMERRRIVSMEKLSVVSDLITGIDITAELIYNNIGNEVLPRMPYILNRLFKLMTSAIIDAGIVSFFCVLWRISYVDKYCNHPVIRTSIWNDM